jgi:hypothetical protein
VLFRLYEVPAAGSGKPEEGHSRAVLIVIAPSPLYFRLGSNSPPLSEARSSTYTPYGDLGHGGEESPAGAGPHLKSFRVDTVFGKAGRAETSLILRPFP